MNDNNNNYENRGSGIILAFIAGFMSGAIIGLLYAPSSGENTREKIREVSIDTKNRAVEFSQQTIDNVGKSIQNFAGQTEKNTSEKESTEEI